MTGKFWKLPQFVERLGSCREFRFSDLTLPITSRTGTHAADTLERGAKIHQVKSTLGQVSVTITGRYLDARPYESFLGDVSGYLAAVPASIARRCNRYEVFL